MTYRCVLVTEEKLERPVQIFANDFTNAILVAKQLLAKYAEAKIVIYKEVETQLGFLTKAGYISTDRGLAHQDNLAAAADLKVPKVRI